MEENHARKFVLNVQGKGDSSVRILFVEVIRIGSFPEVILGRAFKRCAFRFCGWPTDVFQS